jgi:hypothetical protein
MSCLVWVARVGVGDAAFFSRPEVLGGGRGRCTGKRGRRRWKRRRRRRRRKRRRRRRRSRGVQRQPSWTF